MRAVLYCRVSSDPRGIGRSVAEQEADCRTIADREGWDVVEVFVDNDRGASRYSNGDRPAYRQLVDFLQQGGADVLVTWEASRAQRDLDAYVRLRDMCREAGVLWSYSGSTYDLAKTDDAFRTGLDALLGEYEASKTRDRTMRAVRANAAKGRPHGKVTYGYRRIYDEHRQLVEQVVREDQAAVVREAARRVLAGETPYAVAKDFNARGIPTAAGAERGWDLTQIKRLCTRPAYIAKRTFKGETFDAQWPPILDEATFYALIAKLNDPGRRDQRDSSVRHLLSGIALCGVCVPPDVEPQGRKGQMRVQRNRSKLAYMCVTDFHVARKESDVDGLVTALVVERLSRPDALEGLAARADNQSESSAARAEAEEKRARLEGFYDAAAAGQITPAALARIEQGLLPEIEDAERRAREGVTSPVLRELADPDLAERWGALPITTKREAIDTLMVVRIMPAGRGKRTFDPRTVHVEWRG